MPDKGRHDKIGYMWLDPMTWEITKNKDMIGNMPYSELYDPYAVNNVISQNLSIQITRLETI